MRPAVLCATKVQKQFFPKPHFAQINPNHCHPIETHQERVKTFLGSYHLSKISGPSPPGCLALPYTTNTPYLNTCRTHSAPHPHLNTLISFTSPNSYNNPVLHWPTPRVNIAPQNGPPPLEQRFRLPFDSRTHFSPS